MELKTGEFTFSTFYFLGSYLDPCLPLMFLNALTHLLFIMLVGLLIRLELEIRFYVLVQGKSED